MRGKPFMQKFQQIGLKLFQAVLVPDTFLNQQACFKKPEQVHRFINERMVFQAPKNARQSFLKSLLGDFYYCFLAYSLSAQAKPITKPEILWLFFRHGIKPVVVYPHSYGLFEVITKEGFFVFRSLDAIEQYFAKRAKAASHRLPAIG